MPVPPPAPGMPDEPPEPLFSWRVERPGAVLPAGVGWAVTLRGVNACCSTKAMSLLRLFCRK